MAELQHVLKATPPAPLFAGRFARSLIRLAAAPSNPILERLVRRGWIPFFGIIQHVGRKTGKPFSTPVGAGMVDGGFVIPLTFGDHSHWYRNVAAANGCVVVWRGNEYTTERPHVVGASEARPGFPAMLWVLLQLLGIIRFLRLEPAL